MIYEEKSKKKRKKRRRRGPAAFFGRLILRLILLVLAAGLILYALPVGLFLTERGEDVSPATDLDTGVFNLLILGVDNVSQGTRRSDTLLIASVGYQTFCLTSVLRDTMVEIPGHGMGKINAAYNYGGAELTMRTLNQNFGLNLTRYVVVDFATLADLINALGGVDISLTQKEQDEINRIYDISLPRLTAKGYNLSDFPKVQANFSAADADGYAPVHLDGYQALVYARIRKIDSDFGRTHRQRKLVSASLSALKQNAWKPWLLYRLGKIAWTQVDTNLNPLEAGSLGLKILAQGKAESLRLPADGTFTDTGSALTEVDFAANRQAFLEFVYSAH